MMVSTTPAWGMELTTSSLGAMSPYHQAKARGASPNAIYIASVPKGTRPLDLNTHPTTQMHMQSFGHPQIHNMS
jgi:hypothetical protein